MSRSRCDVLICTGGGCVASGALELSAAMRAAIEKRGLAGEVQVFETGCLGPCAAGPVARSVTILPFRRCSSAMRSASAGLRFW